MKAHQFESVGALQWGALGLDSSDAEDYQRCKLCERTVNVRYNANEGLADAMERCGVPAECPKGIEQPTGGPKIFCFVNGGSPGWFSALAICEDGHCLAGHTCSSEGWAQHDLGIGSDWKHDKYREHCPNGFELVWVDDPKTHPGLQAAYLLNQELARKKKESEAATPSPS